MVARYLGFSERTTLVLVLLVTVLLSSIALYRGTDPFIVVASALGSLWIVNEIEKVHGR